jgi:hypothetical protein
MKKSAILKIAVLVGFIGMLVVGAAGYFGYVRFLKPVLAFQKATEVMKEFETAEFEMTADYTAEFPDINMNLDMVMEGTGKINVPAEELQMDMVLSLMGESVEFTEVISDGEIYIKMGDEPFQKTSMDEALGDMGMSIDDFEENQMWSQYPDAEMEYLGVEEIDGKKYYTYKLDISGNSLDEFVDNVMKSMSQGTSEVSIDDVEIESVEVKTWVDAKTSMPYKEEVEVKNARFQAGQPVGEMVMDMVMEMTYFNVNEPVEIEVPEV